MCPIAVLHRMNARCHPEPVPSGARVVEKPILKHRSLGQTLESGAMASSFNLDGSMVPRSVARAVDHRREERVDVGLMVALLEWRGSAHVVSVVNISRSGAMLIFSLIPYIGEPITLRIDGQGVAGGRVLWVRNGRIGVGFDAPLETA